MLRRRYQILLIAAIVLGVFYPANFAEFNSVDDMAMVNSLKSLGEWRLKNIFLPNAEGGLYYRPLLYLSQILDKEFWSLHEGFMHLENVLLHLANTLLVYYLALQLLNSSEKDNSCLPLIAALCFGLHPLNTEPVSWVSGRTDVLAGTFVLLSALFVIKFKIEKRSPYIFCAIVAMLLAMLTKEVAFAFLPGALFILSARITQIDFSQTATDSSFNRILKKLAVIIVVCAGSGLLFYVLRSLAYKTNSVRIKLTLMTMTTDWLHSLFVCLRAFGFYMKKLFFPFPLNFAILEVDPLYELLAIPIVLLCVYIAFRRSLLAALFLSGVFLLTPSFIIAFNQVAWTPYAERYLYIPCAFIVIATVFFLGRTNTHFQAHTVLRFAPVFLILIGAATVHRNVVWMKNLTLYKDTVNKTPDSVLIRNEYGAALVRAGKLREARRQFEIAKEVNNWEYNELPDLNSADIDLCEGKYANAINIFTMVLEKKKERAEPALEGIITGYQKLAELARDTHEASFFRSKLLDSYGKLYALKGDPYILYRMGQVSLGYAEPQKALGYFRQAYDKLPEGNEYKKFSHRHIARLARQ